MVKDVEYSRAKGQIKPAGDGEQPTVAPLSGAQPEAKEILAKETAELARTQILAQAGTAMLAQANQSTQSVLSLLR